MKYVFLAVAYFAIGYILPTLPLFFQIMTVVFSSLFSVAIMIYLLEDRYRRQEIEAELF